MFQAKGVGCVARLWLRLVIGISNLEDSQSQNSRAATRAISVIVKKYL